MTEQESNPGSLSMSLYSQPLSSTDKGLVVPTTGKLRPEAGMCLTHTRLWSPTLLPLPPYPSLRYDPSAICQKRDPRRQGALHSLPQIMLATRWSQQKTSMAAALAPFPCTSLVRLVCGAVVSGGGEGQMAKKVMSYPGPTGLPQAGSSASLFSSDPQIGHKLDIIVSIKKFRACKA